MATRGAQRAPLFALLCVSACTREQAESGAGDAVVAVGKAILADDTGVLEMIELDAVGPAHHGRRIKVHGYVMRDTILRRGDDEYRFDIARRGARLQVDYKGVLPQDFAEQREVIASGVLADDGTTLVAAEVLSRCPEDYEELERAPAG
jgi:cytochrome c-type biogenesis protein CcmE